jgi:integrase
MRSGRERTFLAPLLRHFGETALERIDQQAVDEAAELLYPRVSPATRNRQVYTPVSAILNYAGRPIRFRRPKAGAQRTLWLTPEQFEILAANLPPKLRRLAIFLVYSGCRLGEALSLTWQTVSLEERVAYVPATKNGLPRAVHITERMLEELADIEPKEGRVFGYRSRWSVAHGWREGAIKAGLPWASPHILRHTWATWMRRYSGADLSALIDTGAWRDVKSALRYVHVVPSEESKRADRLPAPPARAKSVERK